MLHRTIYFRTHGRLYLNRIVYGFIAHGTSLTVAFIVLTALLVVSAGTGKYAYMLMEKSKEAEA